MVFAVFKKVQSKYHICPVLSMSETVDFAPKNRYEEQCFIPISVQKYRTVPANFLGFIGLQYSTVRTAQYSIVHDGASKPSVVQFSTVQYCTVKLLFVRDQLIFNTSSFCFCYFFIYGSKSELNCIDASTSQIM